MRACLSVCPPYGEEYVCLCVCRYNQFMGGVDRCDQLRGTFSMEKAQRTRFWYKKLFLGIFGVALSNAYVLWRTQVRSAKSKKDLHFEFYNGLANALCGQAEMRQQKPAESDEVRLSRGKQHFLEKPPEDELKAKRAHERCALCFRQGRDSRCSCRCDTCMVYLCSPNTGRDCFKQYHILSTLPSIPKKVSKASTPRRKAGRPPKAAQQSPPIPAISP